MKKILAFLIFTLYASTIYAQSTDAELTTQANQIRNETTPGANTAVRVGDMFLNLVNSKVNVADSVVFGNGLTESSGTVTVGGDFSTPIQLTGGDEDNYFLIGLGDSDDQSDTYALFFTGIEGGVPSAGLSGADADGSAYYFGLSPDGGGNSWSWYDGVNGYSASISIGDPYGNNEGSVHINAPFTVINSLAGTGTRMVVADNVGKLSTQAIPAGGSGVSDGDKGDITVTSSGATWTIDSDAVTYAKIQNVVANNVLLGNNSGAGGIVDELTATEVTAMLNTFSSSLKGLVPSSGGGTTNFMRADGTWAAPPAGTVTSVSGTTNRVTVASGTTTPTIDISSSYVGQASITTTGTLTSGATGSGFTVNLGSSTVSGTLPVANFTPQYVMDLSTPSTGGSTITLDMNSQIQRVFIGSASFSSAKTIALSNTTNARVFNFHFEVTNVAAVLDCPSSFLMADENWDGGADEWTPPATGKYEMGGVYDGTNWKVKVVGPYN